MSGYLGIDWRNQVCGRFRLIAGTRQQCPHIMVGSRCIFIDELKIVGYHPPEGFFHALAALKPSWSADEAAWLQSFAYDGGWHDAMQRFLTAEPHQRNWCTMPAGRLRRQPWQVVIGRITIDIDELRTQVMRTELIEAITALEYITVEERCWLLSFAEDAGWLKDMRKLLDTVYAEEPCEPNAILEVKKAD